MFNGTEWRLFQADAIQILADAGLAMAALADALQTPSPALDSGWTSALRAEHVKRAARYAEAMANAPAGKDGHLHPNRIFAALRKVLGGHVQQKGSLVDEFRTRFDFSHPKPMTAQELERVEDIANDYVTQNSPVTTRLMALDDARASGARALFGEKYGDEVRVVAMGDKPGSNTLGWSVELCGGTHVRRTGDIGLISVVSDSGVAAGVRRLEALTGRAARKAANTTMQAAQSVAGELLRVSVADMPARVTQLLDERKKLERDLAEAKKKLNEAIDSLVETGSKKLLTALLTAIVGKAPTPMPPDGQRPTGPPVQKKDLKETIIKSPELPLPWDKPKKPTQNYFEFRGLPRKARAGSYIDFKLRTPHWFEPYGKMGAGRVVVMKAEEHKKEGDRATKLADKRIEQKGEVAMSLGLPEEPGAYVVGIYVGSSLEHPPIEPLELTR